MRRVIRVPTTAWNNLVVAVTSGEEGLRCELRDGRILSFGPEWQRQIAITDRLYILDHVIAADRATALYLERNGRLDLAQIPTLAARPPKQNRRGEGFVILDAAGAQHGIETVLVTSRQIRDYFFAPDRSVPWTGQPSWFALFGVRETSTPAEIRLAYRIRSLERNTGGPEFRQIGQTQLARGLQILLNPTLREEYQALLQNPEHQVAFPPWTLGCLLAAGEQKGTLFAVHRLLRFQPQTAERAVRLALRRFRFEGPEAVYRDARRRLLIRFDSSLLPMPWTGEWNTWAHLARGSTTVQATFWQQTRFRRRGTGFEPTTWAQPFPSTLAVENAAAVAPRFEAARVFWNRFHPHADLVALLRAHVEREPMEAEQAVQWCLSRGVCPPVEARWINWEPDYEESYYRELTARAQAVYLFRNEYLFVFEQTIISEIPRAGRASYIFHPSVSREVFLRNYTTTTRQVIRRKAAQAGSVLGYAGRIPHAKDLSVWLTKIERRLTFPSTRP